MQEFFEFNILNFFSLFVVLSLLVHANFYFRRGEEKLWKKVLLFLSICITLDILAWLVAEGTGASFIALSYIVNISLFTFCTILSTKLALFLCHLIEGKTKVLNKINKVFWGLTGINFLLLVLSIPFGIIFSVNENNVYVRESLYFLMISIILLPIIAVLIKLILKYIKEYNKMFSDNKVLIRIISLNVFGVVMLIYLQQNIINNITLIFPFLTLSILILHLILISKAITIDYLTKMQNKLGLELTLGQFPKISEEHIAAIFFDLDNFKTINDTLGHKEGDKILIDFATILSSEIKNKDIVARIGGDEFLVVLKAKEKSEIDFISDSIAKAINAYNSKNEGYKIEYSYGISINEPFEPLDKEALIEKADKKMYESKFSKNRA
jgi:diguanylate cyclase (GGDEF)-like protein